MRRREIAVEKCFFCHGSHRNRWMWHVHIVNVIDYVHHWRPIRVFLTYLCLFCLLSFFLFVAPVNAMASIKRRDVRYLDSILFFLFSTAWFTTIAAVVLFSFVFGMKRWWWRWWCVRSVLFPTTTTYNVKKIWKKIDLKFNVCLFYFYSDSFCLLLL